MDIGHELCFNIISAKMSTSLGYGFDYFHFLISIGISIDASICISFGFDLNIDISKYYLYIDTYGKFGTSLALDSGLCFKSKISTIRMCLTVGLEGKINSIQAGIKLYLYLTEDKFEVDIYFIYKPFEFTFYIMMKIDVEIFFSFFSYRISFQFYIYNKVLFGLKYEIHRLRGYQYNCKKLRQKMYKTYSDFDYNLLFIKSIL